MRKPTESIMKSSPDSAGATGTLERKPGTRGRPRKSEHQQASDNLARNIRPGLEGMAPRKRGRPPKSEVARTEQARIAELDALARRAGGSDDAGPGGGESGQDRMADVSLVRAFKGERVAAGNRGGKAAAGAAPAGGETGAMPRKRGRPRGSAVRRQEVAGSAAAGARGQEGTGGGAAGARGQGGTAGGAAGARGQGGTGGGAERSRAGVTRGNAAATMERPGARTGTAQRGQGSSAMEVPKRRKSPRMGKVMLEPAPIFNADEIRDIRLRLRMSQMSFADLLGVSVKAVEAWEAGRNRPGGPALRLMDLYVNNPDLIPYS